MSTDNVPAQYLTFTLGDELFAMDISTVREIIQHGPMTIMPMSPDFVRGVINLRGAVVPVIDLQCRFGRPRANLGKKTCVVILDTTHGSEKAAMGLMVDAVSEVIEIAPSDIEPAPDFGSTIDRSFIRGVGKVKGAFIVILDPERALDMDDMAKFSGNSTPEEAASTA